GGLVVEGSIFVDGTVTKFTVTDGRATIPVTFTGILPDLFAEDQGMIATGALTNGLFEAKEILAKHDEEYMPKEVADALKEQGFYKPIKE
ncbi:MAG: cytochrome c maturation protein CcmE, partial [Amylibacter sp.]|nr:cytochrome c maturation protein CcmE [Amylibacter sp.]